MAKTVGSAFEEFNKEVVNLAPDRTKKARDSRDWLIKKLSNFETLSFFMWRAFAKRPYVTYYKSY